MGSFVENVNKLSLNLDTIIEAKNMFDDSVLPILQEVADLDLQDVTNDLHKGNYLGNRKIDIDLLANNTSLVSSVAYSKVDIVLSSGVVLQMPFVNAEANILELTSHADIKNYIVNHALWSQVVYTELTLEEAIGAQHTLIRFRDADGHSSNIERVILTAYSGSFVEAYPSYFWAKTTSSLQTLANRIGDIISLGNDIDSIITLSERIDEMVDLQEALPELNTIYANLSEILLIDNKTADVAAFKTQAEASALSASQSLQLTEQSTILAQSAASTAVAKSNEIKAITTEALTGTAGAQATVSYNPATGKFTFYVPQGIKGDKGEAFTVNATGTVSQKSNYDTQVTGFSFLATDESKIYFKNSATSGDWSAGSAFGKGDKGDTGDDGRSVLSIVRTAGTGAGGSTDTYTITYSDTSTSTFQVYNGIDSAVTSVNGRVGLITLSKTDVGLTNVDNTSDANKPVSTAQATAIGLKADNNKSIFIGTTSLTLDRASASQTLNGISIGGNAGTATKLAATKTINGVAFDGSANINIEDRLGTAIASAATTTLGSSSTGDTVHVTGTTTITSFGASVTGVKKTLIFDAALTLTHNATSLILPASLNVATAAGDSAEFVCENGASGYWRCIRYTPFTISVAEIGYLDGVTSAIQTQLNEKQETLVSGTNIKTINSSSILGSGDLVIASGISLATANSYDLGVGQTWQDVVASRVAGTTYTNTDGKPREVWISVVGSSYIQATYYIDNVARSTINTGGAGYSQSAGIPFIVPNNSTYKIVVANGSISNWHELR